MGTQTSQLILNPPSNLGNKYFCLCFWKPSESSDMFDLGPVPSEQTMATLPLPLTAIMFFQEQGLPPPPSVNLSISLGSLVSHVNRTDGFMRKGTFCPGWYLPTHNSLEDPDIQKTHTGGWLRAGQPGVAYKDFAFLPLRRRVLNW